ncbi:RNI-like protein [Astrocystis sublimbata]|nr:RNI-like protein [Astrocystis sublimbata]
MDSMNPAQQILPDKSQRRASFSPMKAIRSLSVSSQISHLSIGSETDVSNAVQRRRTLRKINPPPEALRKESLIRNDSKSSTEGSARRDSTSTQPTTPSIISRSASLHGDAGPVIKSGALQPEASLLKSKREYLVLTPAALLKFKSRAAAVSQFPTLSNVEQALTPLSPVESHASLKDLTDNAQSSVPLERIVSVFKDEGTRPSFGLEIWWKGTGSHNFVSAEFDFPLPDERDDWLKQIRQAARARVKAVGDEQAPPEIESYFDPIRHERDDPVEIFPVIPRRPYTGSTGELRKNWRESSSFYLVFSKYSLLLAHFSTPPNGQKVNPYFARFGLVTLSRVRVNVNDERFDLAFRLPMEAPEKIQLASRHYRTILSKLFLADTYLKPAWPLWTRREVFHIDDSAQQPLPNGQDFGGFRTTLEAFVEGYRCQPVEWTVKWKDVHHAPRFCLLKPRGQSHYSARQLLAVLRALRFNEFFRSISFQDVDFSSLSNKFDNTTRLESTIWLSRTGKHSLTRSEADMVETSSVLFQELVALLIGTESIRHIDLTNVLRKVPSVLPQQNVDSSSPLVVCEVVPPLVLLWSSSQTRCNSVTLNGNAIGEVDAIELCRVFQSRPNFLRGFEISRCNLDEASLVYLWEGLHEQRFSLEELDTSYNSGRIEASRIAYTLNEATGLRHLNLAYTIRGELGGPLFRPWSRSTSSEAWRLEDLDLSGWKLNFETLCGIMKYLEIGESNDLRRLALNNCALTGELVNGIFCRIGTGREIHLHLNGNPLEAGSRDWIDLIHGNEAPTKLHLDMIQFQSEATFNDLLRALSHNKTIKFLSLVGTGPPDRVSLKTSELLSNFFRSNDTLEFLDLSGYSGKLEDGHLGWGLSDALGGLKYNTSLRQLRLRNHEMGAAEDLTELCRIIAANKGLAMFDIQHNNFDHHQLGKLVQALSYNHQLISFLVSPADRDYAVSKEKRLFMKTQKRPTLKSNDKLGRSAENRLQGALKFVRECWDAEALKVKAILEMNKNNPANQDLQLESEYLEAWQDDDLPQWLVPKPPKYYKGKRRASTISIMTSVGDVSPPLHTPSPVTVTGHQGAFDCQTSGPRQTYVIEEEA